MKRKLIIEVHDGVKMADALSYVQPVIRGGMVSGPPDNRQHCFHTVFKDGVSVSVVKRRESETERFIVRGAGK